MGKISFTTRNKDLGPFIDSFFIHIYVNLGATFLSHFNQATLFMPILIHNKFMKRYCINNKHLVLSKLQWNGTHILTILNDHITHIASIVHPTKHTKRLMTQYALKCYGVRHHIDVPKRTHTNPYSMPIVS
ncbi:hypothetical protein V6Z12_A13G051100 [Gossypium hirsutum]